ncbi:hypothetical protein Syun_000528 [Stephania yunnanensis]|uniref:Uncharacterized protein n=1 Tax=Stephania yunnanensis TaxID=152371 RepID=A0AAP0LC56_9MAGN
MASVSRLVSKDCSLDRNQPDLRFRANLGAGGRLCTSNVWRNGGKITTLNLIASPASSMLFTLCRCAVPKSRHQNILCKAKANLSGNVPNSSQGGLSHLRGPIPDLSTIPNLGYVFIEIQNNVVDVGCAVITAAESGASFPLKRRDLMLDYILTLMGRKESDGYPGSNLELLHTQSVALSVETEWRNSVSDPFPISNGSETECIISVSDPLLIRDGSETECIISISDPLLIRDGSGWNAITIVPF